METLESGIFLLGNSRPEGKSLLAAVIFMALGLFLLHCVASVDVIVAGYCRAVTEGYRPADRCCLVVDRITQR